MVSTIPTVMASFSSGTANQTSVTNETAASANKIRVNGLMNASASRERNGTSPWRVIRFSPYSRRMRRSVSSCSPLTENSGSTDSAPFRAAPSSRSRTSFLLRSSSAVKTFFFMLKISSLRQCAKGRSRGRNHFRRREECGQPEAPRPGGSTFRLLPSSIFHLWLVCARSGFRRNGIPGIKKPPCADGGGCITLEFVPAALSFRTAHRPSFGIGGR